MSVIVILILASLALGLLFLAGFVWAVRAGQYDDTSTPSLRVLTEESDLRASAAPEGRTGVSPVAAGGTETPLVLSRSPGRRDARPTFPPHFQSESNRT